MTGSRRSWLIASAVFGVLSAVLGVIVQSSYRDQGHNKITESQVNLPAHRLVSIDERKAFVGSETCLACHRELKAQTTSRHAQTLASVKRASIQKLFAQKAQFFDGLLNAEYTTDYRGGACLIKASSDHGDSDAVADYAFGSGNVATTFVGHRSNTPIELRLSLYNKGREWNLTPGHEKKSLFMDQLGKPMDPKTERECFLCHSTALVEDKAKVKPELSLLGVGCETCHGPGKEHVRAAKSGRPAGTMVSLSAYPVQASMSVCGQCHRSPVNVDLEDEGQRLQLPRWQALGMSMSACFKKASLGCATCHNPHENADVRSASQYNAICLSCHQPRHPQQKPCRRAPAGDCVSCHMPKQGIGMPTNPKFHNHWIKVWE